MTGDQSIDLLCKSMDWFLYDNGPRHERVKFSFTYFVQKQIETGTGIFKSTKITFLFPIVKSLHHKSYFFLKSQQCQWETKTETLQKSN